MNHEPNIAGEIWGAVEKAGLVADLSTAERRLALDKALRARLGDIEDDALRSHAAEMIRAWRAAVMGPPNGMAPRREADMLERIGRLERLVAKMGRQEVLAQIKGQEGGAP
jgi:hypothetical protein